MFKVSQNKLNTFLKHYLMMILTLQTLAAFNSCEYTQIIFIQLLVA